MELVCRFKFASFLSNRYILYLFFSLCSALHFVLLLENNSWKPVAMIAYYTSLLASIDWHCRRVNIPARS